MSHDQGYGPARLRFFFSDRDGDFEEFNEDVLPYAEDCVVLVRLALLPPKGDNTSPTGLSLSLFGFVFVFPFDVDFTPC
jgi:hypothetical protein